MLITIPPVNLALVYLLFGQRYFTDPQIFLFATLPTLMILSLDYIASGMVAGILQQ